MFKRSITILICFVFSVFNFIYSQTYENTIKWKSSGLMYNPSEPNLPALYFDDYLPDEETGLPLFVSSYALEGNYTHYDINLSHEVFEPLSQEEALDFPADFMPGLKVEIKSFDILRIRKKPVMNVVLLPFRQNEEGEIEKLMSFRLEFHGNIAFAYKSQRSYAERSVLADGNWVKIKNSKSGVCKITGQELLSAGLQINNVNPDNIRLYGNGGAMLPEQNDILRIDDLQELAIEVITENSWRFGENDCILFYNPSPHNWKPVNDPENLRFEYEHNLYSDYSFYFLTISDSPGKRVQSLESVNEPFTHKVLTFHDFAVYKPDSLNLGRLGRRWYGNKIDGGTGQHPLPVFKFPDIDSTYRVLFRSSFALNSSETSRIKLYINDNEFLSSPVNRPNSYWLANTVTMNSAFFTADSVLTPAFEHLSGDPSSAAWVDFIEVNLKRNLKYTEGQFPFRDPGSVGEGNISKFMLAEPADDMKIWDISAFEEPYEINYQIENDNLVFNLPTPELRWFVAFSVADAYKVISIEPIQNQNLHGLESHDLIIVAPEILMSEAEEYARLRRETSGISVLVVSVEQIYNEFSSGSLDPTAIRDFMKMFYDRAQNGHEPRYLLLFGDGSYDSKDRITDNKNLIPTYQSVESLKLDATYVCDDYYGLLDDGEGYSANGALDIGIGRFPVKSPEEAAIMRVKAENYLAYDQSITGNWRNTVTLIAHDEDIDKHFLNAEELANYISVNQPVFNIRKIYLDAYKRVNIPGGYRYPDVNKAINDQVKEGALLINYIGHGGETGWAHSRVLTVPEINSWNNIDNMPVFITATCSFGRFDDPALLSAGEMVVLNPKGGGIALFTTTRLAYSAFNHSLNRSFTRYFFEKPDGENNTLGNIMMLAKNANNNNVYIRNFVLLGDPSLQPAKPRYQIQSSTTQMGVTKTNTAESGLTKVSVNGSIKDHHGNTADDYNGILYPVVFDKPVAYTTNANHSSSSPRQFTIQNSVIYKGRVSVENGKFSFDFLLPEDVSPMLGTGKISYFASNGEAGAHGYFDDFLVGGFAPIEADYEGPQIDMYLNTPSFTFGDFVNENSLLVAHLRDKDGINSFGLGIGHEIIAFLDENTQNPIFLNDFFEPDLDSYTGGTVRYYFKNLTQGRHSLRFKAYDLFSNSSEAYTEFIVTSELPVLAGNIINKPNPFSTGTWFVFEHNYFDKELNVTVEVFDLTGQLVKTIGPVKTPSLGTQIEPIYWNGRRNDGSKLNPGIYPYRIKIETKNGFTGLLNGKAMILH